MLLISTRTAGRRPPRQLFLLTRALPSSDFGQVDFNCGDQFLIFPGAMHGATVLSRDFACRRFRGL